MDIAFIDWTGDPARPGASGLSDLTWAMARRLAQGGDNVHVFGPYTESFESGDVVVHRFPLPWLAYRNIVGHMRLVQRAISQLRQVGRWDIIHAPEYLTTAFAATVFPGTPVILTVPGNIYERVNNVNHFDPITTQVYKVAARVSARRCAAIIATSQEQAYCWSYSGALPNHITTIPLGVDTSQFRPARISTDTEQNIRHRLLFVGRLQGENGASIALKAFATIRAAIPTATLRIVGNGPDRPELMRLGSRLGLAQAVQWDDHVRFEELPRVYQSADIFLFPRLSRVTPRVLFEAMASGLPIVTSAIGGLSDFVVNGQTGMLADPHDPESFAQQAIGLLRDPQRAKMIGARACDIARQQFDWEVVVRRIRSEVYMPLCQTSSIIQSTELL